MATQQTNTPLNIANPPLENQARAYLDSNIAAGATTIPLLSSTGLPGTADTDYYAVIGSYEDEKSDIVLIDASSTTGTQLTCSATSYAHAASEPITYIGYNQIRVYGGTTTGFTPSIDSPIATISIDTTVQNTEYIYVGTTYSYFVTAYYDSTNDVISSYSDEVSASTFTRFSSKRIIESAVRKAMTKIDDNYGSVLSWDIALEVLQDGIDEILARKRRWSFLKTINSGTTTTTDQAYISKPTDLSQLLFLRIDNKTIEWMSPFDYSRYTESINSVGIPDYFTERDNAYYLYPTPNSSYDVVFDYYKLPATLTSLTTEVDAPFMTILIYYCAAHYAYIRGNDKRGDKLYPIFEDLLEKQVIEYSGPAQDGFAEYVERTNTLSEGYMTGGEYLV